MNYLKIQTVNTCVGIVHIGEREKSGLQIVEKLKQFNFKIRQWDILKDNQITQDINLVDVIIVNIGSVTFEFDELLSTLFELDKKIIFNEAVLTNELSGVKRQSWERHLLNKIDSTFSVIPDNEKICDKPVDFKKFGIDKVWVLAASIGGPEALLKFLNEFKGQTKLLFIIIQHIDKEFIPEMASQLNLTTNMQVKVPLSGTKLAANMVFIYPTDEHLYFTHDGVLELMPLLEENTFSPCIDESCKRLSENIKDLNIAVFSGMSNDGIKAAKMIKDKGNKVITQTESSCVLSTIIAGVKKSVMVDFDGNPAEMAHYVIENSKE